MTPQHDVVILGGGLAGQLCVLALAEHAPAASVVVIERAPQLGGNHTWCCHASDLLDPAVDAVTLPDWFAPLVDHRWRGHRVRFPGYERRLGGEYLCLRSASLARATAEALSKTGGRLVTGAEVAAIAGDTVTLASGEMLTGRVILDARGAEPSSYAGRAGYQKFVGWEIELDAPVPGDGLPILMDATVAQKDGYRFVYTLPFSRTHLLVEDTYFSRRPDFDLENTRGRLAAHLRAQGMGAFTRLREEVGVLPMPWGTPKLAANDAIAIGYRGGFFHPATGYSLPRAAIVADCIARLVAAHGANTQAVSDAIAGLRAGWAANDRFARWLNRFAFNLVPERHLRDAIFDRVYRLPEPMLARFYAGRTTRRDRMALLAAPLGLFSSRSLSPNPLLGENP